MLVRVDGSVGITVREILAAELDAGQGGDGERLLCRACGNVATSSRARIAVGGAHEHRKTNPTGITFHIGCFRHAPGALAWGEACAEHTWFAGHTWQIALCGRCGLHLGWAFHESGARFHGLILDRLRAEPERGPAPGA
jgi:hypothetical protein